MEDGLITFLVCCVQIENSHPEQLLQDNLLVWRPSLEALHWLPGPVPAPPSPAVPSFLHWKEEEVRGSGRRRESLGEGRGGWSVAGQPQPWQPAWLSCSSLDVADCRSSLLGPHNPLDCCIKTITWFFAPFQLCRVASPLEEAINNKERLWGRERGREAGKGRRGDTGLSNAWRQQQQQQQQRKLAMTGFFQHTAVMESTYLTKSLACITTLIKDLMH